MIALHLEILLMQSMQEYLIPEKIVHIENIARCTRTTFSVMRSDYKADLRDDQNTVTKRHFMSLTLGGLIMGIAQIIN
jgi:hypothetical protein